MKINDEFTAGIENPEEINEVDEMADQGQVESMEELREEIARLRGRGRRNIFIAGALAATLIAFGTVMYLSKEADSASSSIGTSSGYQSTSSYGDGSDSSGTTTGYSVSSGSSGYGSAAGGGGCCGGGGAGAGTGNVSLQDLEKEALSKYKQETGDSTVKAKATNYGCHIQVDITNAKGQVVRSYGYQGGPLYVIK